MENSRNDTLLNARYTMKQADLYLEKNFDINSLKKKNKGSNRENIISTVF